MPGLLRGLGADAPGKGGGLLFDSRRGVGGGGDGGGGGGGGDLFRGRGGRGEEEMGPAEFGLLMGEDGDEEGNGAMNPLLPADDWVRGLL